MPEEIILNDEDDSQSEHQSLATIDLPRETMPANIKEEDSQQPVDWSSSSSSEGEDEFQILENFESDEENFMGSNGASTHGTGPYNIKPSLVDSIPSLEKDLPFTTVPETLQIKALGYLHGIVDNFFVVQSTDCHETLEIGSLIAISNRLVLGKIYDVLGQVSSPAYSGYITNERLFEFSKAYPQYFNPGFNSEKYSSEGNAQKIQAFYIVDLSSFIDTKALSLVKGSDASNAFDEEAEGSECEYSNDEEESRAKSTRKNRGGKAFSSPGVSFVDTPAAKSNNRVPNQARSTEFLQEASSLTGSDEMFIDYKPLARQDERIESQTAQPSTNTTNEPVILSQPTNAHSNNDNNTNEDDSDVQLSSSENPFGDLPSLDSFQAFESISLSDFKNVQRKILGLKKGAKKDSVFNVSEIYKSPS